MNGRRSALAALRNQRLMWADAESVAPPTVTSGGGGTYSSLVQNIVTYVGTGFSTIRRVLYGTSDLEFSSSGDTNLAVTFPAGSVGHPGYVIIETRGGQVYPPPQVNFVPEVSAVSPASGPASGGTPITLTGNGFLATDQLLMYDGTGFVSVPFTIVNNTTITATTPDHTNIGPTAVVTFYAYNNTTGGYNTTAFYTYTESPLTFVSCTPANGDAGAVTPVTVVGTGFYGLSAIELEPYITGVGFVIVNDSTITFDIDGPGLGASPSDSVDFRLIRTLGVDEIMAVAAFIFDP